MEFSHLVLFTPRNQKVENASTFIIGSQVQTGIENWYRKHIHGFNFLPIRSDPMLIFLSGNRLLGTFLVVIRAAYEANYEEHSST